MKHFKPKGLETGKDPNRIVKRDTRLAFVAKYGGELSNFAQEIWS